MSKTGRRIYPVEPWTITETAFDVQNNYRNETTFALSNGYIGTRGTFEEGYDFSIDEGLEGNFINGFYESEPIRYGEWNFGFPEKSQSLLNLPNLKTTRIQLDGEAFDLRTGVVDAYQRTLHMREGIVTRTVEWTAPGGKRIRVETVRLVSLVHSHCMAASLVVTPLNFSGEIALESILNADVENHTRKTNPLVDYGPYGRCLDPISITAETDTLFYHGRTRNSRLGMACCCVHAIYADAGEAAYHVETLGASVRYTARASQGEPIRLEKYTAYADGHSAPNVLQEAQDAARLGMETLRKEQVAYMRRFWEGADVEIDGDDAVQQGIRFNLFHIMQAAGRNGRVGMGAKGVTGEGYEGHYFWDTEMYVLPVFIHTFPEIARPLLDYRVATLEEARKRARVLGHPRGALYPWRTINGQEASTYVPLGTAQYHINADIAHAFHQYVKSAGDTTYLKTSAAEVLCETARVWADVGHFAECRGGQYCICKVTGPDEYNAFVDNNFYTNLMARENLRNALEAIEWLRKNDASAYTALVEKIGLGEAELTLWQRIIDNMYFPYNEERGIHPQDDGFMMLKPWDDNHIPSEKRHLLYENYHPLYIWRQRMAKQADAILGMYLHSNFFSIDELRRNYDFYQEVTLHHSSLSTCIFGILACQIGYFEEAYAYFEASARMDLDDHHNNFYAGIHAANMAGTWQAIVNGFAGMRTNGERLSFAPHLPEKWNGYRFRVTYQSSRLAVTVARDGITITLVSGAPATLDLKGKQVALCREGDTVHETLQSDIL